MDTNGSRMERLRWRFRLWAEDTVERVRWTHRQIDLGAGSAIKGGAFDDFVDRISPWVEHRGYRRTRLRRWLYRLRHSRRNFIQTVRGWIMAALIEYQHHPGRYEGNTSHLIAAYLDTHSEEADDRGGDSELGGFYMIFGGGWPWGDAAYVTAEDSRGFFSYVAFDDYVEAQRDFSAAIDQPDDEPDMFSDVDEPLDELTLRYMHGDK